LLLAPAQLIKLLKIEPRFWAGAEPVAEPQRGVGRYRSLTVNEASDSIRRDVDLSRQLGGEIWRSERKKARSNVRA
jgi:hypothetical protein